MRVPRFFHPAEIITDTKILLSDDATHHAVNVLRLKQQHPIVLFNGDGNEYSGLVTSVSKRQVEVTIDACLSINHESPLPLHLGQGVSKGDRMEWVLQKAVELGVQAITPIITERCAVKIDQERWFKKHAQWQKVIIGACEQSGRNRLPQLHTPCTLSEWLGQSTDDSRLILTPDADARLSEQPYHTRGYRLLIGPEGGLSAAEVKQATELGYRACTMGPRILRTETAAIAALTVLQAIHGDL